MKKLHFRVTVEMPTGCSPEEIHQYIEEAIQSYKGGGDPNEPLYDLDGDTVQVRQLDLKGGRPKREAK